MTFKILFMGLFTLRCREERYPCTLGEGFLYQEFVVGRVGFIKNLPFLPYGQHPSVR